MLEPDQFSRSTGASISSIPFLPQPAQAPVALHAALEFGVGGVGQSRSRAWRRATRPTWREGRRLAAQAGDQLPLIDQVAVAPQRRGRPGVAVDAEPLVRRGDRGHAHLARGLGAVEAATPARAAGRPRWRWRRSSVRRPACRAGSRAGVRRCRRGQRRRGRPIAVNREVVVLVRCVADGLPRPPSQHVGQFPEGSVRRGKEIRAGRRRFLSLNTGSMSWWRRLATTGTHLEPRLAARSPRRSARRRDTATRPGNRRRRPA